MRGHDVAIPVGSFSVSGDHPVLRGATREAIKAMPAFEYTRRLATKPAGTSLASRSGLAEQLAVLRLKYAIWAP